MCHDLRPRACFFLPTPSLPLTTGPPDSVNTLAERGLHHHTPCPTHHTFHSTSHHASHITHHIPHHASHIPHLAPHPLLQPDPEAAALPTHILRDAGVMRVATLDDGSAWCLVEAGHLAAVQVWVGCGGQYGGGSTVVVRGRQYSSSTGEAG